MNFYLQPLIFQSILVILGVISFSPELKAQDVTNPKPTTTPIEAPQPMPPESNTPNAATCEGKTPSARPLIPKPTGSLNSPEIETPGASELIAPIEGGTSPLDPSSPVPRSQPTSPN